MGAGWASAPSRDGPVLEKITIERMRELCQTLIPETKMISLYSFFYLEKEVRSGGKPLTD
jgi:hypothetical protein